MPKRSKFGDLVTQVNPVLTPDGLTIEPFDGDGDGICPEPEAIVRYLLGGSSKDPALERHFLVCPDCRIEFEALKEAFGQLEDDDDVFRKMT